MFAIYLWRDCEEEETRTPAVETLTKSLPHTRQCFLLALRALDTTIKNKGWGEY